MTIEERLIRLEEAVNIVRQPINFADHAKQIKDREAALACDMNKPIGVMHDKCRAAENYFKEKGCCDG